MDIAAPVEEVKGIGPKTAAILAKAGILTLRDLIYHLPRTYENFQQAQRIAELKPGLVTIEAVVDHVQQSRKGRLTIVEASLRDDSGSVRAVWFNQPYRVKQLSDQAKMYFTGKLEFNYGRYQLMNPAATLVKDAQQTTAKHQLLPIYPARGPLKTKDFHKFISQLLPQIASVPDMVPCLPGRAEALLNVHAPKNPSDAKQGRDYLATEELFCLLLAARLNRDTHRQLKSVPVKSNLAYLRTALKELPFKLTNAQRRSLWEIIQDMSQETPMNRLLQGDVGSGKTLVAALSALMVAKSGAQTALMAPTEVLASQHAETLAKLFGAKLRIALLTGSTKHKTELKKHIASGEIDLVIGTHALLTDDVKFHQLNLAIIDEQHRFGVAQRQKLLDKAHQMPHLLAMTATPIPRSLQLTIFGDLAVSVIDELPAGRQPITTKIVAQGAQDQLWRDVEAELQTGHQAYYICKKIDESGNSDLASVKREYLKLTRRFPQYKVALLHGRMKPAEKDSIMSRFATGEINLLVSTTVVEVGVDVPNATVIAIADADNYGLSQLHQLRGRVGRGDAASFCYLINSQDAPSRRLREIAASQDGFYLAEIDLKLRGPGEIYGALQHGALDLRIASVTDTKLIHRADALVQDFMQQGCNMVKYKELSAAVRRYQRLTTLN